MAKNDQKIKLLKLYELLKLETDESHPLTTKEICERLGDIGITCDRRTLSKDIALLNEYDYEIMSVMIGHEKAYYMNGRSDLTAVDNDGNIVLIEIKRDLKDIEYRKAAFEFQAIRYAASYATIETIDELVKKVYVPYIEKYSEEFKPGELTYYEFGMRKLEEFLSSNDADKEFNNKQKIILVASDFDEQTLSAVAWLNNNNVDTSCYKLVPYKISEELYVNVEKILPIIDYNDYYVNLMKTSGVSGQVGKTITRRNLPKIDSMLEWGVVKPGDIIKARVRDSEAQLQANGNVIIDGEEMSMQVWLKDVYGWSSVHTYVFAIHKESGKSLNDIREEYMENEDTGNII